MTPTTDASIPGPSMTGASHNYFVLEKHERDIANSPRVTEHNDSPYYSSTLIVDNYEDPDAVRETSFGTPDAKNELVTGHLKSPHSGNIYNTFKQFQQHQEDYDHLCNHNKRPPQVTDNVYSTTQNVMTIPAMDDTYHHLGQHPGATSHPDNVYSTTQNVMTIPAMGDTYHHLGQIPGATNRPDNVYGMPRVDGDYDRMPPLSGTQLSATIQGGADNYSTFNKKF